MPRAKETTLTFFVLYLSPLKPNFVQAISPILFNNIWLGHISGQLGVPFAIRTTLGLLFLASYLPEQISKQNSYALHNFLMV